jgi:phosphatidate cytidylyltransferase
MLVPRIITASILAALISLAVIFLPPDYFSLVIVLIILIAAWEWSSLIGLYPPLKRGLFVGILLTLMALLFFWTQFLEVSAYALEMGQQALFQHAKKANWISLSKFMESFDIPDVRYYSGSLEWLVILPVIFWVFIMLLIRNKPNHLLQVQLSTRLKAFIGGAILLFAWLFLSRLRAFYGWEMVLYLLILIWLADIAAYFVGKKYGKTRLAPDISPGKTIEGMYGALGAGLVCALAISLGYGFQLLITADFILLSLVTVLISIYGDLFFSVAKRIRGVKDSGNLLPGHGGLLDRIDSAIAAVPVFYAGIILIYRQVA